MMTALLLVPEPGRGIVAPGAQLGSVPDRCRRPETAWHAGCFGTLSETTNVRGGGPEDGAEILGGIGAELGQGGRVRPDRSPDPAQQVTITGAVNG